MSKVAKKVRIKLLKKALHNKIVKTASNPLSRTFTTLFQYPLFQSKDKKNFYSARISMLNSLVNYRDEINSIENNLLSLEPVSVYNCFLNYNKLINNISSSFVPKFNKMIESVKEPIMVNKEQSDKKEKSSKDSEEPVIQTEPDTKDTNLKTEQDLEPEIENKKSIKEIYNEVNSILEELALNNKYIIKEIFKEDNVYEEVNSIKDILYDIAENLKIKIKNFIDGRGLDKKVESEIMSEYSKLNEVYNSFINKIKEATRQEGGSISELFQKLSNIQISGDNIFIVKTAKYDFSRFVRRLKMNFYTSEEKQTVTEVADMMRNAAKVMNEFMNVIENKNMDIMEFKNVGFKLFSILFDIGEKMIVLGNNHNLENREIIPGHKNTRNIIPETMFNKFKILLNNLPKEQKNIQEQNESPREKSRKEKSSKRK